MKKSLTFLFLFGCFCSFAKQVSIQKAAQIANNFYLTVVAEPSDRLEIAFTQKDLVGSDSLNLFYIFNISNKGFVIVSAEDRVTPILGYSTDNIFHKNSQAPAFMNWVSNYSEQIKTAIENKILASEEVALKWRKYENEVNEVVSGFYLVKTNWGQDGYYNDLCPKAAFGTIETLTGCVATAMAQVLKYWNFPNQGSGTYSYSAPYYGTQSVNYGNSFYNWSNMPNKVTSSNNDVAKLMYHCGVSVNMDYGKGGSSAVTAIMPNALKTYFSYSSNAFYTLRNNISDAAWNTLLKKDLDNNQPIIYRGSGFDGSGGHCFVCDGYDTGNYYHFNWGWDGSENGYFYINNLLTQNGDFSSMQGAIIGIKPKSGTGSSSIVNNLKIYSDIFSTQVPVTYGTAFDVSTKIGNLNTFSVKGDFAAALFNQDEDFVDFVDYGTLTLDANKVYDVTFECKGLDAVPDKYILGIFFKETNGEWMLIDKGKFNNPVSLEIIGAKTNIKLFNDLTSSVNPIVNNETTKFKFDISNTGTSIYKGNFTLDLHNSSGEHIKELASWNTNNLCANCHFQNGLSIDIPNINEIPADYYLAVWHKETTMTDWELVEKGSFKNPIKITIVQPQLKPDIYEPNNTMLTPANLAVNFQGNVATVKTVATNRHEGTDLDYFKLVLPTGYNYEINSQVIDSKTNSSYSNDVVVYYKTDNNTWSSIYDDVIPKFTVSNGGALKFGIVPFDAGSSGTYQLVVSITRKATTAIEDLSYKQNILVYPNPFDEIINIEILLPIEKDNGTIDLISTEGRLVKRVNIKDKEGKYIILTPDLPSGLYLLNTNINNIKISSKIIKK